MTENHKSALGQVRDDRGIDGGQALRRKHDMVSENGLILDE